jgi:hypothetical protein
LAGQVGSRRVLDSIRVKADLIPPPPQLYRYYGLRCPPVNDTQFVLRQVIVESRIWFADPTHFNDPFECRPAITLPTPAQVNAFERRIGKKYRKRSADDHEYADRVQAMRRRVTSPAFVRASLTEHLQRIGVLCLVDSHSNTLMWSHYADNHKGVCLEFDSTAGVTRPFGFSSNVCYQAARPGMIPTELHDYGSFDWTATFIRSKSTHWEYEREWRCLRQEGPGLLRFDPSLLTGVYLGVRINEADARSVIGMTRWHSAQPSMYR